MVAANKVEQLLLLHRLQNSCFMCVYYIMHKAYVM
jgi:hypothetical protein